MIKSIKCRETRKIFDMEPSKSFPVTIHQRAYTKLRMLHNSASLIELRIPPSNCLEKLVGDRDGQYSIRVNKQWRICFKWIEGDACDVEIVDYHS
jgi:proteic killer suppression protein